jgi:hypothetical protein
MLQSYCSQILALSPGWGYLAVSCHHLCDNSVESSQLDSASEVPALSYIYPHHKCQGQDDIDQETALSRKGYGSSILGRTSATAPWTIFWLYD